MLKIHHSFILQFLGIFTLMGIIASFVGYFTLKESVISDYEVRLKQEIGLIESTLQYVTDMDRYIAETAPQIGKRITVIASDGTVAAESDANREEMENHANREEVMAAAKGEYGQAVRFSHTIGIDFLYVAKRVVWQGSPYTLRLAVSLQKVLDDFYTLLFRLATVLGLLLLVVVYLAIRMSRKIRYDIAQLSAYLEEISDKNYKAVVKPRYFTEFLQISLLLKNLVKKLAKRERQKRKYTARLRLINKQRNDILSAISHEFKNPIASIVGYAETLYDDPEIDGRIRQRFLQKITANAQKISTMLDRLSLSVKLENNDLAPSYSRFDLCELATECANNITKKYTDRTLEVSCASTFVEADRTMIDLVVTNLLDNAMKYSESAVHLEIHEGMLWVHDRGIGIAAKEIERISSKFYRVEKNTWDNSMGLGLSIVSYILALHGTKLQISSVEGEGSSFGFGITPLLQKPSDTALSAEESEEG
ncbi:sensor histidine kinase [Sulfurimonas diazotrophicus]|uniref:histidine kinase n=1 Tax=Sulfurimonas diazotrophicus TaxID=3131939 RepID=A0ABZ3H7R4_9BACT